MYVFSFKPNWRSGFTETLTFNTEVFTTTSGVEYREFRRIDPMWLMNFSVLNDIETSGSITAIFTGLRDEDIHLASPVHRLKYVSGPASRKVFENPGWVKPGHKFLTTDGVYEAPATLEDPLALYPVSETVTMVGGGPGHTSADAHLLVSGFFEGSTRQRFHTDSKASVPLAFKAKPSEVYPHSGALLTRFSGNSFLDMPHNWSANYTVNLDSNRMLVNAPSGAEEVFFKNPMSGLSSSMSILARGEGRFELPAFFTASKGKYRTFFALQQATFTMAVMEGPVAVVDGIGLGLAEELAEADLFFAVQGTSGFVPRKVVGVEEVAGKTRIELNGEVPGSASTRRVRRLHAARFANDKLTIDWRSDSVAELTVALLRLRKFPSSLTPITNEVTEEITTEAGISLEAENIEMLG